MYRTNNCGELNENNVWDTVMLSWWVSNRRDHGGIIFIDLRDRYGITQVVFDPEENKDVWDLADKVRSEYVIKIQGKVRMRPDSQFNEKLNTGKIEILVDDIETISKSKTPPFEISDYTKAWEQVRYKHRYLDLRRDTVKNNVKFRHKFLQFSRNWFADRDFLEVTTPIFTVSSPEWSRDYIVPSRIHKGEFYALPQAPQQYKQLLMVGGIDKYFQIAPCFRDEDTRADRHACEFYQLDCEMSFVETKDVMEVVENYMFDIVDKLWQGKHIKDWEIKKMTYKESIDKYGTDKPDLRFGLEFVDVTEVFSDSEFSIFKSVYDNGGAIKTIKTEWIDMSRKDIDELTKVAQEAWAKGLAYIIYEKEGPKSPILKFFSDEEIEQLNQLHSPNPWDIIFFSADEYQTAVEVLGQVRLALRDKYDLADSDELAMSWIVDFPMYEKDPDTGKIDFEHNPFSMPKEGLESFDKENPLDILGKQYDLAINGEELLSWSIRNHDPEILYKAFDIVWMSKQQVRDKFGAMLRAFEYGAPPHGGFAIGIDRFMMLLCDEPNVREIYAFPKSGNAQDVMMWAPSKIDDEQLEELNIELKDTDEDIEV